MPSMKDAARVAGLSSTRQVDEQESTVRRMTDPHDGAGGLPIADASRTASPNPTTAMTVSSRPMTAVTP